MSQKSILDGAIIEGMGGADAVSTVEVTTPDIDRMSRFFAFAAGAFDDVPGAGAVQIQVYADADAERRGELSAMWMAVTAENCRVLAEGFAQLATALERQADDA